MRHYLATVKIKKKDGSEVEELQVLDLPDDAEPPAGAKRIQRRIETDSEFIDADGTVKESRELREKNAKITKIAQMTPDQLEDRFLALEGQVEELTRRLNNANL